MHNQTTNHTDAELYTGAPEATAAERAAELTRAKRLAERYRLEFVDLSQYSVDHDAGTRSIAASSLRFSTSRKIEATASTLPLRR